MGKVRMNVARAFESLQTKKLAGITGDAKSFYFNFLMAVADREMIGVMIENPQGVFEYWRFEANPFGLSSAPHTCCAMSTLVIRALEFAYPDLMQCIMVYVDDYTLGLKPI